MLLESRPFGMQIFSLCSAKLKNELWFVRENYTWSAYKSYPFDLRTQSCYFWQMIRQAKIRFPCSSSATPCLILLILIALQEPAVALTDTNSVFSPCAPLQPIALGDAITVAVALGGNRTMWYNSSDPKLNLLSPCSPNTASSILAGSQVTVFRPMVDQLSLFQIYNQTLTNVATTFPGAASLLVYTGYKSATDNETIVSAPRTFSTPAGKVGGLLLVMEFEQGVLRNLTWKDDDCADCGNNTSLCLDHNCATSVADCASLNSSNPDACFTRQHSNMKVKLSWVDSNIKLADECGSSLSLLHEFSNINVAYSGTDKNSLSFKSWMNVQSVTKYSLSALYFKADALLQKGIQSIIDENNQVGTGGQV